MKKVFIVDDSMFIITQLTQILTKGGYHVVGHAVNGEDAIKKIPELADDLDLITIDITMPGIDGIGVLERLKVNNPNIKFVIISAIGKKKTVIDSKNLGADAYIIKPLSTTKVLNRLKKCF